MITSAKTAVNQIPALHKWLVNEESVGPGRTVVDYGGGPYDKATEFLAEHGIRNLVYDPHNRSYDHNVEVAMWATKNRVAAVLLSNVLNVIQDPEERINVLRAAAVFASACQDPPASVYITVYEGDRSGVGKETTKGWQENRKRETYRQEVMESGAYVHATWVGSKKVLIAYPMKEIGDE